MKKVRTLTALLLVVCAEAKVKGFVDDETALSNRFLGVGSMRRKPVSAPNYKPVVAPEPAPMVAPVAKVAPSLEPILLTTTPPTPQPVLALVSSDVNFSIFRSLFTSLPTEDTITLFIPTMDAIDAYDREDRGYVSMLRTSAGYGLHRKDFTAIHVIAGKLLLTEDLPVVQVTTLSKEKVDLVLANDGGAASVVTGSPQNKPSTVVQADMMVREGVVHAIDRPLLPFWMHNNAITLLENYDAIYGEQFSTLRMLFVVANLEEALREAQDITLLAPGNSAFPEETRQELLRPDKFDLLQETMLYHVIDSVVDYTQLPVPSSTPLATLQGQDVEVTIAPGGLTFNQASTSTFILVKYGTVYPLDEMLVLPSATDDEQLRRRLRALSILPSPTNVALAAQSRSMKEGDISRFLSLLSGHIKYNAVALRTGGKPYRVFSPSKFAYQKMGVDAKQRKYFQQLTEPEYELHLTNLVGYHATAYTGELLSSPDIPMSMGGSINVAKNESGRYLRSFNSMASKILEEKKAYGFGEIFTISNILVPEWMTLSLFSYMQAFEHRAFARYSAFLKLWVASGSDLLLRGGNRMTLLAPDNTGISEQSLDFLLNPDNIYLLNKVIGYHVLPHVFNYLNFTDFDEASSVRTFVGENVLISYSQSDRGNHMYFNDQRALSFALTKTSILYRLDGLLIPPSLAKQVPVGAARGDFVESDENSAPMEEKLATKTTSTKFVEAAQLLLKSVPSSKADLLGSSLAEMPIHFWLNASSPEKGVPSCFPAIKGSKPKLIALFE